ncbi:ATP-dependent nuclease [Micromonospora chalcea]|uniref:ATP-dependent nuclease n=1 Tax=Micromonospora chalcea TaxID=1874 RepID=UPI00157CAC75|nr:AAA family ATPase [Micromonospora chalcea]
MDTNVLLRWLNEHHNGRAAGQYSYGFVEEQHFPIPNTSSYLTSTEVARVWSRPGPVIAALANFLVKYMGAEGHGALVGNHNNFYVGRELPSSPTQILYLRRDLEQIASDVMQRAFGVPLTVHRYAGSMISLHVGSVEAEEGLPPGTDDYRKEIESLPTLQEQGDGMRAFMGIVLTVISARFASIFIDEPEAFLHPPQAYLLGKFLAEQHDNGAQVLVATHSDDIMRGIMSVKAATGNVTIVRLTRDLAGNHVAQVPAVEVQGLYEDPLIKYYGILDGLFSHGVVLCEADSDCTYYRAVLESTVPTISNGYPTSAVSLHFTHCGGKARLSKAVRALHIAKVPVVCAVDIDMLQDEAELFGLIQAFDGDSAKLKGDRNVVLNAISTGGERIERNDFERRVNEVLKERKGQFLTPGDLASIRKMVTPKTGWKAFKKVGRSWLRGDAIEAFDRIDTYLRSLGIFLVPVGELEGFHPEVPSGNKAAWLRRVLEEEKYLVSPAASAYSRALAESVWARQSWLAADGPIPANSPN